MLLTSHFKLGTCCIHKHDDIQDKLKEKKKDDLYLLYRQCFFRNPPQQHHLEVSWLALLQLLSVSDISMYTMQCLIIIRSRKLLMYHCRGYLNKIFIGMWKFENSLFILHDSPTCRLKHFLWE